MKKMKTYTIQEMAGVPCLTIRGEFLTKEFGIEIGAKVKLLEGSNLLALVKQPVAREEAGPCGQCGHGRKGKRK